MPIPSFIIAFFLNCIQFVTSNALSSPSPCLSCCSLFCLALRGAFQYGSNTPGISNAAPWRKRQQQHSKLCAHPPPLVSRVFIPLNASFAICCRPSPCDEDGDVADFVGILLASNLLYRLASTSSRRSRRSSVKALYIKLY